MGLSGNRIPQTNPMEIPWVVASFPMRYLSYIPMMFPNTRVSQTPCERLRFVQEKYDFRQRLLHAEESLKYLTHRLVIVWQWRGGE